MRVCDRHPDITAEEILQNKKTYEEHDMCKYCVIEFKKWLLNKQPIVGKGKLFRQLVDKLK